MKLNLRTHSHTPDLLIAELRDDDSGELIAQVHPTDTGLKIVSRFIVDRPDLIHVDTDSRRGVIVVNLLRQAPKQS